MQTIVKNARNRREAAHVQPFVAKSETKSINDEEILFKIEDNIPLPKRGQPASQVTKEALHKLSISLNLLQPGQSFVFGNLSVGTVRKYLREEFPELKTRIQINNKEKRWYRLWLMK